MDARGKFGELEAIAESNSSFPSALQTSQVHPYSIDAQLNHEPILL